MTVAQSPDSAVAQAAFDYGPLEELLEKYQGMEGALIPLLQGVQAAYGYLPKEALIRLAEALGEPLSSVFGVATFYAQFRLIPRAKNVVRICHGTACHVSGSPLVSLEVEKHLGIQEGENTEDMVFTLEGVACLGACGMAPVMMINDHTYGKLSPDKAVSSLKEFRASQGNGGEVSEASAEAASAAPADAASDGEEA